MSEIRAADLPEGSIVALWHDVAVRNPDGFTKPWMSTSGPVDHWFADEILKRGGKVLRHGYGDEG